MKLFVAFEGSPEIKEVDTSSPTSMAAAFPPLPPPSEPRPRRQEEGVKRSQEKKGKKVEKSGRPVFGETSNILRSLRLRDSPSFTERKYKDRRSYKCGKAKAALLDGRSTGPSTLSTGKKSGGCPLKTATSCASKPKTVALDVGRRFAAFPPIAPKPPGAPSVGAAGRLLPQPPRTAAPAPASPAAEHIPIAHGTVASAVVPPSPADSAPSSAWPATLLQQTSGPVLVPAGSSTGLQVAVPPPPPSMQQQPQTSTVHTAKTFVIPRPAPSVPPAIPREVRNPTSADFLLPTSSSSSVTAVPPSSFHPLPQNAPPAPASAPSLPITTSPFFIHRYPYPLPTCTDPRSLYWLQERQAILNQEVEEAGKRVALAEARRRRGLVEWEVWEERLRLRERAQEDGRERL